METLPLVVLVIALTIGLGITAGSVDAKAVKADWANRRCDPLVVAAGFMYKPDSDNRSAAEFGFDNMKFCTEKFVKHTIMEALTPIFAAFGPIVGLAGGVNKIFNGLRQMLHSMYMSFLQIIEKFYKIFERYILQASRVTQQLRSAFMKINASLVASVYMSISMLVAGYNSFKFIVLVTKIILGVISGLAFVLMFVLAPFGALIAAVTGIISTAINVVIAREMPDGFEGTQYSTSDAFCFGADTKIKLNDGTVKPISELNAGEHLGDGCGQVQGMLTFDGSNVPLYSYQGVIVSGEHLVFEEGAWKRVEDSKVSVSVETKVATLFCPITTSHKVPVVGSHQTIMFADWEEMDEESISVWDEAVCKILHVENPSHSEIAYKPQCAAVGELTTSQSEIAYKPHCGAVGELTTSHSEIAYKPHCGAVGELGGDVYVMSATNGRTAIRDIQIGDYIDCINKKGLIDTTRVLGIYKGDATTLKTSSSIGHGVWKSNAEGKWYKEDIHTYPGYKCIGYHLITDSGTFLISAANKMFHIRDFTEVGLDQLPFLTPKVIAKLNT